MDACVQPPPLLASVHAWCARGDADAATGGSTPVHAPDDVHPSVRTALQFMGTTRVEDVLAVLRSDALPTAHEDAVLDVVQWCVSVARMLTSLAPVQLLPHVVKAEDRFASWRRDADVSQLWLCVRWSWLSPPYWQRLMHVLDVQQTDTHTEVEPPHLHAAFESSPVTQEKYPATRGSCEGGTDTMGAQAMEDCLRSALHCDTSGALHRTIMQHLIVRSARQADAVVGGVRFGAYACAQQALLRRFPPRASYGFSLDVHGVSHAGASAGLFFIWVNKHAPFDNNDPFGELPAHLEGGSSPSAARHRRNTGGVLPEEYRKHIRKWAAVCGRQPTVFNGAQCLAAVAEVASHPHFCPTWKSTALGTPTLDVADSTPGAEAEYGMAPHTRALHARRRSPALCSSDSLLALYRTLAAHGNWIQCVDMARFAILWLVGAGSMYLDTDTDVGTHALPRALYTTPSHAASANDQSVPPLLVIPEDAENLLQNNMLAVTGPHQPFVTRALQAMAVSALEEQAVVCATGPSLLTALWELSQQDDVRTMRSQEEYALRQYMDVVPHPSSSGAAQSLCGAELHELRQVLPTWQHVVASKAAEESDAPLRAWQDARLHSCGDTEGGPGSGAGCAQLTATLRSGRTRVESGCYTHAGDNGARVHSPLGLSIADTVSLLPPTSFFPVHWRAGLRTAPEAPWRDDGDDCEADARCAVELQNAGTPSTSATAAGGVVLDSVAASSGTITAAAQSCAPVMGTASEVLAVQGDLFVPPAGPQLAVSADNLTAQPLYGIHKWHCTWGASSIDAGSAYVCSPSTTSAPPVVTALRAQGATQGVYVPSTSSNAAAAVSLQARAYPVYVPPRFESAAVMHASRAEGKQGEEEETGDEFQVQALKSRLAARLACAHW